MEDLRAITAAKEGDLNTLQLLHRKGVLSQDVADSMGAGLVHHTARSGHLDCLKFLVVQVKLSANQRALNGATPVHDAAAMGNLVELQWLTANGGSSFQEPDSSGASPLHLSARFGHAETVQWLVQAGSDLAMETREGAVPAHYAAANGHLACLKLLVTADSSCVNKQTCSGATPLYLACQEGHVTIVQYLVKDCAADVNLRAHDGMTVLHAAAYTGHYPLIIWLATFTDINLSAQDTDGATALHFAARGGHPRILEQLLIMGSEVLQDFWGGTPLHDAAENGQLQCCQALIAHQVDPKVLDRDGYTAGNLAAYNGHKHCAQYLQQMENKVRLMFTPPPPPPPPVPMMFTPTRADFQSVHLHVSKEQEAQAYSVTVKKTKSTGGNHSPVKREEPQVKLNDANKGLDDGKDRFEGDIPGTTYMIFVHRRIYEGTGRSTLRFVSRSCSDTVKHHSKKSLISELSMSKYLQKVKTAGMFNQNDKKNDPHDESLKNNCTFLHMEEFNLSDIDTLVPTHNEENQAIPEWKRQVMVRKLQVQLEENMRTNSKGSCMSVGGLRYSQAHNAVLGPYGELLTDDDLLYLEKQIESLQMRKKCQEYESELRYLANELQNILPAPIVNITVNTQFLHQETGKEHQASLPVWCNHISSAVNNMSLLLTNINDKDKEKGISSKLYSTNQTQKQLRKSLSNGTVEREILEFGVSVRNLRVNFEKQSLLCQDKSPPFHGVKVVPPRCSADYKTFDDLIVPKQSIVSKSEKDQTQEEQLEFEVEDANNSGIGSEKASTLSHSAVPSSTLRKERIIILFLSHWKKSAYTMSLKIKAKETKELKNSDKMGDSQNCQKNAEGKTEQAPKSVMENNKLGHLLKQRSIIKKLIDNWKNIISHVPSRQIRILNRKKVTFSPEQLLPHINGALMDYNCLTLDLFMLGYFQILELDLSTKERQMRHLLCYEVFDHLGRYGWEVVRAFHKAVIDEIDAGKREWKDGFEDIKTRFFGQPNDMTTEIVDARESMVSLGRSVPKVVVQSATLEKKKYKPSTADHGDISNFNNDEICRYIDRSFAFWKEKEAEIFDFEE
ncbi:espin-like protein [Rhinatrema bivittatum]|uniref:espin-like protein n=1 Tax=Rhinatrema bivittatum TaxID=194408 RepID=UPI001128E704|nr:espin-like protein [Rhinatrema bivittatum]